MRSEIENVIIHLWDLKPNSLINIKEIKHKEIKNKNYKKFRNISNFCLKYSLPYQKVQLFLLRKSNISIKNFIKMCRFLGYSIGKTENYVSLIKYRSTSFPIVHCRLVFRRYKKQKSDEISKIWKIEICDKRNLEKTHKLIKIPLQYKQDKLNEILKSYKQLGKGELHEKVKDICRNLLKNQKKVNIPILSKLLKWDKETIREIILKLENSSFLVRLNRPSGSIPLYYGVKDD